MTHRRSRRVRPTDAPPPPPVLRIAVLSDLHAFDSHKHQGSHPSFLDVSTSPRVGDARNPVESALELIKQENLGADLVLCGGDMGDKAHPLGIRHAWAHLETLRDRLGARAVIATSGNHDVDSRYKYNNFDAKGVLQALTPPYPLPDHDLNDRYWSRNFALYRTDQARILVINSSAYHGTAKEEYAHGRVAETTLTSLANELKNTRPARINIALCHHHPHQHPDIDFDDYSEMKGGLRLLELLGSGQHGSWLIIHGHKHLPRIAYAAGGSSAPIVFAAGSFSAILYRELQTLARNQFYILSFPQHDVRLPLAGQFRAWSWSVGAGWLPAGPGTGLPSRGGFGYRCIPLQIAAQVADALSRARTPFLNWITLVQTIPLLAFVIPDDLRAIAQLLIDEHSLNLTFADDGTPSQVGRRL